MTRARHPLPPVDVRVRLRIEQSAAVTITVDPSEMADIEKVKQRAVQSIFDGDLKPEIYHITVEPELAYRLDARCKIKDREAATLWCRIHDDPIDRRTDPPSCYRRPHDGQPAEYGR